MERYTYGRKYAKGTSGVSPDQVQYNKHGYAIQPRGLSEEDARLFQETYNNPGSTQERKAAYERQRALEGKGSEKYVADQTKKSHNEKLTALGDRYVEAQEQKAAIMKEEEQEALRFRDEIDAKEGIERDEMGNQYIKGGYDNPVFKQFNFGGVVSGLGGKAGAVGQLMGMVGAAGNNKELVNAGRTVQGIGSAAGTIGNAALDQEAAKANQFRNGVRITRDINKYRRGKKGSC